MTVGDLIRKLEAFDLALPVVTPGFDEGGFEMLGEPEEISVRPVKNPGSHGPSLESPDARYLGLEFEGDTFRAVCLNMG